jgi:hypothetical protein
VQLRETLNCAGGGFSHFVLLARPWFRPFQTNAMIELGAHQQLVLDALAEPRTAPALQKMMCISRQAINQLLVKLIKKKLIRRQPALGEGAQWLYVQSGVRASDALLRRHPTLGRLEQRF